MKNNKKKKGFTLIELIAVIAIIAILAAILVPNIIGYNNKATISSAKANAKIVLNALQAYNADADSPVDKFSEVTNQSDYLANADRIPEALKGLNITQLQNVANGKGAGGKADLTVTEAKNYK